MSVVACDINEYADTFNEYQIIKEEYHEDEYVFRIYQGTVLHGKYVGSRYSDFIDALEVVVQLIKKEQ